MKPGEKSEGANFEDGEEDEEMEGSGSENNSDDNSDSENEDENGGDEEDEEEDPLKKTEAYEKAEADSTSVRSKRKTQFPNRFSIYALTSARKSVMIKNSKLKPREKKKFFLVIRRLNAESPEENDVEWKKASRKAAEDTLQLSKKKDDDEEIDHGVYEFLERVHFLPSDNHEFISVRECDLEKDLSNNIENQSLLIKETVEGFKVEIKVAVLEDSAENIGILKRLKEKSKIVPKKEKEKGGKWGVPLPSVSLPSLPKKKSKGGKGKGSDSDDEGPRPIVYDPYYHG